MGGGEKVTIYYRECYGITQSVFLSGISSGELNRRKFEE